MHERWEDGERLSGKSRRPWGTPRLEMLEMANTGAKTKKEKESHKHAKRRPPSGHLS